MNLDISNFVVTDVAVTSSRDCSSAASPSSPTTTSSKAACRVTRSSRAAAAGRAGLPLPKPAASSPSRPRTPRPRPPLAAGWTRYHAAPTSSSEPTTPCTLPVTSALQPTGFLNRLSSLEIPKFQPKPSKISSRPRSDISKPNPLFVKRKLDVFLLNQIREKSSCANDFQSPFRNECNFWNTLCDLRL